MRLVLLALLFLLPGCASRDKEDEDSQLVRSPAKEQFDEILKQNSVVLVDFQADWCGYCKMMKPIIRDLEKDYRGRVTVVELDIDRRKDLVREYGVSGFPTFLIFRDGEEFLRIPGVIPRIELVRALEAALKAS